MRSSWSQEPIAVGVHRHASNASTDWRMTASATGTPSSTSASRPGSPRPTRPRSSRAMRRRTKISHFRASPGVVSVPSRRGSAPSSPTPAHKTRTAAIARAASQGRAGAKQEKSSGPAGGLVGAARAVKALGRCCRAIQQIGQAWPCIIRDLARLLVGRSRSRGALDFSTRAGDRRAPDPGEEAPGQRGTTRTPSRRAPAFFSTPAFAKRLKYENVGRQRPRVRLQRG